MESMASLMRRASPLPSRHARCARGGEGSGGGGRSLRASVRESQIEKSPPPRFAIANRSRTDPPRRFAAGGKGRGSPVWPSSPRLEGGAAAEINLAHLRVVADSDRVAVGDQAAAREHDDA